MSGTEQRLQIALRTKEKQDQVLATMYQNREQHTLDLSRSHQELETNEKHGEKLLVYHEVGTGQNQGEINRR